MSKQKKTRWLIMQATFFSMAQYPKRVFLGLEYST